MWNYDCEPYEVDYDFSADQDEYGHDVYHKIAIYNCYSCDEHKCPHWEDYNGTYEGDEEEG